MILVSVLDLLVVGVVIFIVFRRGLEAALPFFAFALVLLPVESKLRVPGLFDFTSARIAITAFAALYLFMRKKHRDNQAIRSVPLKYLLLLIIAWSLLATANSIVFAKSLKAVLAQILDFYLVYYLFFKTITQPKTVQKILMAMVAAIAVCCVFGFLEVYRGWSVLDLFPPLPGADINLMIDAQRGLRVRSTFRHPILFGGALAMMIPVALYLLNIAKTTKQKTFLWVVVMMMTWNIYKTGSRGPWLGLILAYVVMFSFQATTRKHLLTIGVLAIAVLVIRPGVLETLENTYRSTTDPNTNEGVSYEGRYSLIRMGTVALAKDPTRQFWGFGPESFADLHFMEVNAEGHLSPAESCDDSWLALAIETGYPGMILVIVLFAKALQLVLKQFFRARRPAKYLYGLIIVDVITFAFLMLSVAIYGWGQQSYLFWIPLAIGMVYPRLTSGKNSHAKATPVGPEAKNTRLTEAVAY